MHLTDPSRWFCTPPSTSNRRATLHAVARKPTPWTLPVKRMVDRISTHPRPMGRHVPSRQGLENGSAKEQDRRMVVEDARMPTRPAFKAVEGRRLGKVRW